MPLRAQSSGGKALPDLKTKPERTEYRETSRYDDVVAFMDAAAKASPAIHITTFGKTFEGRSLPLAVVGAPDATPDAVKRTNKLRVYIQGNIHAGEVEGKESAQILIRELAEGKHADLLQSMVLLIAPIYNADGNERFSLTNRGRQNGPVGGQGQRPNAQNYDLNRDHMKLDSPEAHAFVKLMTDYDPQVALDLHTTNGSRHGYYLTYAPPLNPATDPSIVDLLRKDWLPSVTRTIKSKYNWDYYYYGNIEGRDAERAWRSFDDRPRFNNSYIGLRNRVAILSEAYAYATFEDRIKATSRFVEEVLNYARAHAAPIRKLTADADRRSVVGSKLALRAEMEKSADAVEILVGEVTEEKNPSSGAMMYRRSDVVKPETMPEYGTFKATETERVPSAYYVPAELTKAVDNLRAHGDRDDAAQDRADPPDRAVHDRDEQPLGSGVRRAQRTHADWQMGRRRARAASGDAADRHEAAAGPARVLPDRATLGRRARRLEPARRRAGRVGAGVSDRQDAELSASPNARADWNRSSGDGCSALRTAAAVASGSVG